MLLLLLLLSLLVLQRLDVFDEFFQDMSELQSSETHAFPGGLGTHEARYPVPMLRVFLS